MSTNVGGLLYVSAYYCPLHCWKGGESQPRGSGLEASERGGGRKSALQRLHFHFSAWASLSILAVILLLGQAFAFALSIGLLASSTTGGAANLTGSSCCHFFWETLKNLSFLRGGHLSCCRADKTTSQWGGLFSVLCWWGVLKFEQKGTTAPGALWKPAVSAPSSMLCEVSVTSGWLW